MQDIARVVRFANKHDLRIAVRGHGHSIYGQTLVKGGIVIQMSTLSKARNLPGARVLADAGCSWGDVLEETLKEGATPPVIPDYLGLSVGGTLSIGGISPTTYRYGAQVDNVEALQVVTGEGQIVTCSKHHRADLFDAVLAGQGQCAVIARAVIKLVAAPARVRAYSLLYPDVVTALADSDRLVDEKRFDGVMLFTFANGNGGDTVVLRGTKYYSPPATPDDATMLAGLNFVPGVHADRRPDLPREFQHHHRTLPAVATPGDLCGAAGISCDAIHPGSVAAPAQMQILAPTTWRRSSRGAHRASASR